MVCIYSGAATGVAGILQGMQKRPDPACSRRASNAPQLVVSSGDPDSADLRQFEEAYLESRAGRAGAPFDVGTADGGSGGGYQQRAVEMVGVTAA